MTGQNIGDRSELLTFKRRVKSQDTRGVKVGAFETQFELWGHIHFRFGGEGVFAARLTGQQPATITVDANPQSEKITVGWVAEIDGVLWNVKEPPRLSQDRMHFEMLVARGQGNA